MTKNLKYKMLVPGASYFELKAHWLLTLLFIQIFYDLLLG